MGITDRIRVRWLQWRWRVWQERIVDKHGMDCAAERAKREEIMEALDEIRIRSKAAP